MNQKRPGTDIKVSLSNHATIIVAHPFTVNRYLIFGIDPECANLGDVAGALHVRSVAPCAENTRDFCRRVDVV